MKSKFIFFITWFSLYVPQIHAQSAPPDFSTEAVLKKGSFIKVFTSKNVVYAGEAFEVTYKYYEQFTGKPLVQEFPSFNAFSVQELPYPEAGISEVIDGENYKTNILRHVQLAGISTGFFPLGKAIVQEVVTLPDPTDKSKSIKYSFQVSSPELAVKVLPLPSRNIPAGFNGVTGSFSISAKLVKDTLSLNETGHLLITINGSGNIDAINIPQLNWPKGFGHFDGSDTQYIDDNNFPIQCRRIFDMPFTYSGTGSFSIPSYDFVFFDPVSQKYQSLKTQSIPVYFTGLNDVEQIDKQIIYQENFSYTKYLWIIPVIAGIAFFGGFVSYRKNKRNKRIINSLKKQKAELSKVNLINSLKNQNEQLENDLISLINKLENTEEKTLFFSTAKDIIHKSLMGNKISDASNIEKANLFLKKCDYHLYAPFDEENSREKILKELKSFFQT